MDYKTVRAKLAERKQEYHSCKILVGQSATILDLYKVLARKIGLRQAYAKNAGEDPKEVSVAFDLSDYPILKTSQHDLIRSEHYPMRVDTRKRLIFYGEAAWYLQEELSKLGYSEAAILAAWLTNLGMLLLADHE